MSTWAWIVLSLALLASAAVVIDALRHRILAKMALRNVARRPRQTATVIFGLMIGTAIISASLVAGQSAGSAIREAVFDTLGPTDETVRTEGFYFFPEQIATEIMDDPDVQAVTDAAAPFLFWDAAAEHSSGLFEPSVRLFGFDVARDVGFGTFGLTDGSHTDARDIQRGEAIITADLAGALEALVGDTISIATTLPRDPLLPDITTGSGVLIGASPTVPGFVVPAGRAEANHDIPVALGSKSLTIIGQCGAPETGCPTGSNIRLALVSPSGRAYEASATASPPAANCAPYCDEAQIWLNVTTAPAEVLEVGTWQLSFTADVAAQMPYGVVALAMRPVYDLDELATRGQALRAQAEALFGDSLDFDFFGARVTTDLTVVGITDSGRGRFFGFDNAIFMPLPDAQALLQREGEVNFIKFSNPGTTRTGAGATDTVVEQLNVTIERVAAAHPGLIVVGFLDVNPVKQLFLNLADEAGELMTSLLIFAGSLTIITGLLLIINIFTMLAEERRSELGMARAVGLQRADLVRMFLFEGSVYAAAAAAIGALLGLALAYGLIAILNDILIRLDTAFPPIPFSVPVWVVPVAFAAGLLLTFATISVASWRQSRLNIVRAIRCIEEPEQQASNWSGRVGVAFAFVGVAATVIGWIVLGLQNSGLVVAGFPSFSLTVFGPVLVAVGLLMSLRPYVRRARLQTLLGLVLAAYYVATMFAVTDLPNIQEANIVGPMRGVIMTLGIVVAVANWRAGPRALGRIMARTRRWRAVALPAVSYPQHKRFRTGMTLAMFSIVILSIGFFSIFGSLFDIPAERQTGGFHIEATTTLNVPSLDGQAATQVAGLISEHRLLDWASFDPSFVTVSNERTGQFGQPGHHIYGVDQAFIDEQQFRLLWTLDGRSDAQTYQRLLDEPGTVIVSYPYSTDERNQDLSHEVGETLRIHLGGCQESIQSCPAYTIIGIQEQYHHLGIFLPAAEVDRLFPQADSLYLFKVSEPDSAPEIATELERSYRSIGMDAQPSVQLVEKEQEGFRQILAAMKLFLSLGLIVGVLSLGIVTSRSVLERRQEIGVLRALGYTSRQVKRIFLIEVSMVIAMGFVIGFLCSVIVTYGLWYAVIRELQYPYSIPWLEILYLFAASYVVAMLATVAPILRVGKVAPAEALRYVE